MAPTLSLHAVQRRSVLEPAEAAFVGDVQYAEKAALPQQDIAGDQVAERVSQQQRRDTQPKTERAIDEEKAKNHRHDEHEKDQKTRRVRIDEAGEPVRRRRREGIVDGGNEPA